MQNAQAARPEQSTLSKSTAAAGNAQVRKDLINGLSNKIDRIFPLLDEVLKEANLPPGPYLLMMVFICLQIIAVALWPMFEWQLRPDTLIGPAIVWIIRITLFTPLNDNNGDLFIRFIIFSIFSVSYVMVISYELFFFAQNRRFIKWTLYLTRFYLDFVPLLMIIPCSNFVGEALFRSIQTNDIMAIVFLALGVIYFIIFTIGHYIMSMVISNTSYVPSAPNAAWEGLFHFIFIYGVGVFALVGWLTKFFATWMQVVIIVLKIADDVFNILFNIILPFMHLESNGIVVTLFMIVTVFDLFALIQYFGVVIDYMYHIIFLFLIFFTGMVVTKQLIAIIVKRVTVKLSLDALEGIEVGARANVTANITADQYMFLQEPDKRQLFMNYNLHRNFMKAKLYVRVGLANACPLFIDWSLIKFVSEFHNKANMLAYITQILSYFPCESRLLNYYFFTTTSKSHLTLGERFCIYQVHRVKGFRQSSASSEITEKLLEMKQYSTKGINFVRRFWEFVPRDPSLLYELATNTNRTSHLFNEAIDKWPNNCRLCDDYSYFLIECSTNFTQGLKIKHRSELIEQGQNFAIDFAFRSLVRAYPLYLKKGILDIKGNFIKSRMNSGNASSSSSNGSTKNSLSIKEDLDIELEEALAKASFSYPRLRLAYQRSLDNRKSVNNKHMKIVSFFSLLFAIVIIIFLYVWFYGLFDVRASNMDRQRILNNIKFGFDMMLAAVSIYWANIKDVIPDKLLGNAKEGLSLPSPKTNVHNLQFIERFHHMPPEYVTNMTQKQYNFIDEIQKWIFFSRDNLLSFMRELVDIASSGQDVYTSMSAFVSNVVPYSFCEYNETVHGQFGIGKLINNTLKTTLTYSLIKIANLTQVRYLSGENWTDDKGLCECFSNIEALFDAFDTVSSSLSSTQISQKEEVTKENNIFLYVFSIGYFCICFPCLFIVLHNTLNELNFIMKMMSDIDKKSREEASKPLKPTSTEEEGDALNEAKQGNAISPILMYSMIFVFCVLIVAVIVLIILIAEMKNGGFLELNQWLYYGISRGSLMFESYTFTLFSIICAKNPGMVPIFNLNETTRVARGIVDKLMEYNNNLLRGIQDSNGKIELHACIGDNAELDHLHFDDDCHGNLNLGGFHDTYRCASIDRGISLFKVFINEMLDDPKNVSMELDKPVYHAFHIMNDHLTDPTYQAADILSHLAADSIQSFHGLLSGICFGIIAFLILFYVYFFVLLLRLDVAFEGALQLLRRLPPLSVISNPTLLNYLLNKKEEKTNETMCPSKAVIMNTIDAVLCLNKNESIEVVNKSVAQLFGYTPEQLLGQPIATLIPTDDNPKIFDQLNFMRNGEAPLLFETNTIGISDDEQQIPINLTILGITDNHSKSEAESFVIIVRDVSVILKQQEEAEAAKKQSETLLYQILPRDIVNRLNHGETDISFVVQSSTVIFIDIVKFSDYASSLTPAQIMENLSMVFASFDLLCAKYNLITKIKLIGDVYMAAANLFTPDEPASNHAQQVVQFGLDVLQALEEVNTQLDSSLQVRIGVNTDGPLIAGVLGTDKPVFDIIGDPINVAARLQSNGIPGTVQISQTTYDAVSNFNFNIEPRGEIILKGKGKKMAYIVRSKESSSFFVPASTDL